MNALLSGYFNLICLFFFSLCLHAQTQTAEGELNPNRSGERALNAIIATMETASDADELFHLNDSLLDEMEHVISRNYAFDYPFDSLRNIVMIRSEDLRIFTWELLNANGGISYFGFVVTSDCKKNCPTYRLMENPEAISEYRQYTESAWPGALYYDIRYIKHKRNSYYLLLGINRDQDLVKKRIIEVLHVNEGLRFGKEVFSFEGNNRYKRRIYAHSAEADMSLLFEEDDLIIMDHLSPEKSMYEGKFEFYVPDLSFDALELKKGIWIYKPDFDARQDRNLKDRFYEMELPEEKKIY